MPFKGGTLSQSRTQLDLKCDDCRHQWSIEMASPVLIVRPDRQTDGKLSSDQRRNGTAGRSDDKRHPYAFKRQRMRAGLPGLLKSPDKTQSLAVLYSLNARQVRGRLRPLDPTTVFPGWVIPGGRLWLSAYDGASLRVRISVVKPRREGRDDDEHFAEFAVRHDTG